MITNWYLDSDKPRIDRAAWPHLWALLRGVHVNKSTSPTADDLPNLAGLYGSVNWHLQCTCEVYWSSLLGYPQTGLRSGFNPYLYPWAQVRVWIDDDGEVTTIAPNLSKYMIFVSPLFFHHWTLLMISSYNIYIATKKLMTAVLSQLTIRWRMREPSIEYKWSDSINLNDGKHDTWMGNSFGNQLLTSSTWNNSKVQAVM